MSTYRSVNTPKDRLAAHRIADAACQLFAEQGFAATSMRQIAALASVTKPMVYYYYGSKENLHRRMVERAVSAAHASLTAAVTEAGNCYERLGRLAEAHLRSSRTPETLVLAAAAGELRELRAAAVRTVLGDGEDKGEVRPVNADLFAAAFFAGLEAAPEAPAAVVELLWRGITSRVASAPSPR